MVKEIIPSKAAVALFIACYAFKTQIGFLSSRALSTQLKYPIDSLVIVGRQQTMLVANCLKSNICQVCQAMICKLPMAMKTL